MKTIDVLEDELGSLRPDDTTLDQLVTITQTLSGCLPHGTVAVRRACAFGPPCSGRAHVLGKCAWIANAKRCLLHITAQTLESEIDRFFAEVFENSERMMVIIIDDDNWLGRPELADQRRLLLKLLKQLGNTELAVTVALLAHSPSEVHPRLLEAFGDVRMQFKLIRPMEII